MMKNPNSVSNSQDQQKTPNQWDMSDVSEADTQIGSTNQQEVIEEPEIHTTAADLPDDNEKKEMRILKQQIAAFQEQRKQLYENDGKEYEDSSDGGNLDAKTEHHVVNNSEKIADLDAEIARKSARLNDLQPETKARRRVGQYLERQRQEQLEEARRQAEATAAEAEQNSTETVDQINQHEQMSHPEQEGSKANITDQQARSLFRDDFRAITKLKDKVKIRQDYVDGKLSEGKTPKFKGKLFVSAQRAERQYKQKTAQYERDLSQKEQSDPALADLVKYDGEEGKVSDMEQIAYGAAKANALKTIPDGIKDDKEVHKKMKEYAKKYGKKIPTDFQDKEAKNWTRGELEDFASSIKLHLEDKKNTQ